VFSEEETVKAEFDKRLKLKLKINHQCLCLQNDAPAVFIENAGNGRGSWLLKLELVSY
jgi:hypothetical protein